MSIRVNMELSLVSEDEQMVRLKAAAEEITECIKAACLERESLQKKLTQLISDNHQAQEHQREAREKVQHLQEIVTALQKVILEDHTLFHEQLSTIEIVQHRHHQMQHKLHQMEGKNYLLGVQLEDCIRKRDRAAEELKLQSTRQAKMEGDAAKMVQCLRETLEAKRRLLDALWEELVQARIFMALAIEERDALLAQRQEERKKADQEERHRKVERAEAENQELKAKLGEIKQLIIEMKIKSSDIIVSSVGEN